MPLDNPLTPPWGTFSSANRGVQVDSAQDSTVPVAPHTVLFRCIEGSSDARRKQGSGYSPREGTGWAIATDHPVGMAEVSRTGREGQ